MSETAWLDFLCESETRALAEFNHSRVTSARIKKSWADKFAREKGQNETTAIIGAVTEETEPAGGEA